MAKLTLTDVASGYSAATTVNANNERIETALENTLSRDGTSPNGMNANIDMNSNRVVNLGSPQSSNDAARWADVTSALSISNPVPSQTGNAGRGLITDGTNLAWGNGTHWDRTTDEINAGVTPTDYNYLPGDIRRYGAVGNGVTNDYTAIQNALNSMADGGVVYIPNGNYRINSALRIPGAGITIQGDGMWRSVIVYNGSADSVIRMNVLSSANSYVHVKDVAVLGLNSTDVLVDFSSVSVGTVERCRLWGGTSFATRRTTGVLLSASSSSCYSNVVRDCDIQYCTTGVRITAGANANRVYGGQIQSCTDGILINGTLSDDLLIHGTRLENNSDAMDVSDFRMLRIIACRFEKNADGTVGLRITGGSTSYPPALLQANYFTGYAGGNDVVTSGITGRVLREAEFADNYTDLSGRGTLYVGLGTLGIGTPGSAGAGIITVQSSDTNADLTLTPKGTGVVASTTSFRGNNMVTAAAAGTASAGQIAWGATTQTTVGAAGGASALPATPTGYIIINIAGTNRVVPFYAAS
ncbi:MAG: hypothetical protein E6Q97_36605 [Desulfurellales bacterium]|nr:MAG: hypothetical protein E6Q97_36605 [Desulfurellales bacterium]